MYVLALPLIVKSMPPTCMPAYTKIFPLTHSKSSILHELSCSQKAKGKVPKAYQEGQEHPMGLSPDARVCKITEKPAQLEEQNSSFRSFLRSCVEFLEADIASNQSWAKARRLLDRL